MTFVNRTSSDRPAPQPEASAKTAPQPPPLPMNSAGAAHAPEAPPSIEAATARAKVPSREDFVALMGDAAKQGTVAYGDYKRFDDLLYYLLDVNVVGKSWGTLAGLAVSKSDAEAPTKMSVKAVDGGFDITMTRDFSVGGRLPFVMTRNAQVRLDSGTVTIGGERRTPANAEAAAAAPALPVLGAFGALSAIFSKIFKSG